MAQFEVGKEYKTRSIGDYNCIFTILRAYPKIKASEV